MYRMANEQGVEVTAEISAAINRACEKLQLFLTTTGEDIRASATQFEKLEAEVQRVLEPASGIVRCVQEDWTRSLVPMAHKLDQAARRFIEKRMNQLRRSVRCSASEARILKTCRRSPRNNAPLPVKRVRSACWPALKWRGWEHPDGNSPIWRADSMISQTRFLLVPRTHGTKPSDAGQTLSTGSAD